MVQVYVGAKKRHFCVLPFTSVFCSFWELTFTPNDPFSHNTSQLVIPKSYETLNRACRKWNPWKIEWNRRNLDVHTYFWDLWPCLRKGVKFFQIVSEGIKWCMWRKWESTFFGFIMQNNHRRTHSPTFTMIRHVVFMYWSCKRKHLNLRDGRH